MVKITNKKHKLKKLLTSKECSENWTYSHLGRTHTVFSTWDKSWGRLGETLKEKSLWILKGRQSFTNSPTSYLGWLVCSRVVKNCDYWMLKRVPQAAFCWKEMMQSSPECTSNSNPTAHPQREVWLPGKGTRAAKGFQHYSPYYSFRLANEKWTKNKEVWSKYDMEIMLR